MLRYVKAVREGMEFEIRERAMHFPCVVTREALERRAARDGAPTDDLKAVFDAYLLEIELAARKKIITGDIDTDSGVIIRALPGH
jgi:hypothetical protein